jgi:hypothetical protein
MLRTFVRFVKVGAVKAMLFLGSIKKLLLGIVYIFRPIWINFGVDFRHNNLISGCELDQTRPNESQSLLGGGG